MKLSFVETMRGWLTLEDHGTHPLSFHLRAAVDLSGNFSGRGLIALSPLDGSSQKPFEATHSWPNSS